MSDVSILDKIEWAIQTIRDQLLFGGDDLGAAKAREMRAKGVLLDCKEEITKLKKALEIANTQIAILLENSECRGDEDCDHCMAIGAQKQIKEIMESK